ncbi:TIM-barrel domain-containing protein [Lacticaseibacillus daqingensis]|uniref:TIM-barrel domain-containing protein n=1 Tax=Lacticaseibacillus daqingensis TaxID=2486014 RepID=UPI000F791CA5|nr:TIM-barrel domain-containing protein [Lacticaseibacillus daqingensis]
MGKQRIARRRVKGLLYSAIVLTAVSAAGNQILSVHATDTKGQAATAKGTAQAKTVAAVGITAVTKEGTYFEVTYTNGLKARLSVLTANMFRYYADPTGQYADPEQSEKGLNARILATEKGFDAFDNKAFLATTLSEKGDQTTLDTGKVTVTFDKTAGTMTVKKGDKVVMAETKAIDVAKGSTTQTLKDLGGSNYFGGGTQNGRFNLSGTDTKIVNTTNWVDQGVASPSPFYWSTSGYGVVRNTFKPGMYHFNADASGTVTTTHDENRFDAVYFFDDTPYQLIKDYQELTGMPAMMPRYGFYEAHLNAYNRDYWVKVDKGTSGAILYPDGNYYKEYQPADLADKTGATLETLNGAGQFTAETMLNRYLDNDMPIGWFLPNDGYGAGYGQTDSLAGNIANLKQFVDTANSKGVEVGLWTQQNLKPVDPAHPTNKDRDFEAELQAGVKALKTDVAWVGNGYSFGLNGTQTAADMIQKIKGDSLRPMIVTLAGWAGTQRTAGIWDGDQTGGEWEYIRFHIPTYIGEGLSGQPNVGSDMDGIFGGKNKTINTRDYQWKTFTPIELNMDGWGSTQKNPFAFDKGTTDINRAYLKQKTAMMPYIYTIAHESSTEGKPMVRAMFLDYPNEAAAYGNTSKYQYMWGDNFLVAPIYQDTAADADGNDIRNGIYLPDKDQIWVDYYTGKEYQGGQVLNNYDAPIWKLPLFVKKGAITAKTPAHNTPKDYDQTQRQFEVYPGGDTSTTVYEDDGISAKYLKGESATTAISSKLVKDDLTLTAGKLTGSFAGLNTKRTTEFAAHTNQAPKTVTATVGGKAVQLKAVDSLDAYNKGTDVYYFDKAYTTNDYLQDIDAAKDQINQSFLRVKVGATDVSANEVVVHATGIDATSQPVNAPGEINESLSAPTGLTKDDDVTTATVLGLKWDKADDATSYNIKFDGELYTGQKTPDFSVSELTAASKHTAQVQKVTADGDSPWTEEQTFTTAEDPLKNTVKVTPLKTESAITGVAIWQDSQPLEYLFDRDLATTAHSNWFTSSPKQSATPMTITTKLDKITTLDKIIYAPREDGGNGTMSGMTIAASLDGIHWKDIATKTWAKDGTQKTIEFAEKTKAYYLKFSIPKGSTVGDFVSGEDILVYEKPGEGGSLPGDITNDGKIDGNDEKSLKEYTGDTAGKDNDFAGYVETGDLNQNGTIDAFDINYVLKQLGDAPLAADAGDATVPTGSLSISADKAVYAPGDDVTLTIKGKDLAGVNALSTRIAFNSNEMALETAGIAAGDLTRDMVNFSKVRKHSDGSEDAYVVYANRGQATAVSGSGVVATLKFKSLAPLNGKNIALTLADQMLVNQNSKELEPDDSSALILEANLVNLSGLKQGLAVAEALNASQFTPASFAPVTEAIAATKAALVNPNLTQAQADALQQQLVAAISALQPATAANTDALSAMIDTFDALDASHYQKAAYEGVKAQVVDAKQQLAAGLDATTAATLTKQLGSALADLLNNALKPDLTTLTHAINAAKALKADAYTVDSFAALQKALTAAQAVVKDDTATAKAVNQAAADLIDALAQLQAKAPTTVDRTALAAAVKDLAKLNAADYTAATFAPFTTALTDAQAVLADDAATQAQVDAALTALNTAAAGLQKPTPTVDKTKLNDLIKAAQALKPEDYTANTYKAVAEALAAAVEVAADDQATASQVAKAGSDLELALAKLEKAPSAGKDDTTGNGDDTKPGTGTKPGDGTKPGTGDSSTPGTGSGSATSAGSHTTGTTAGNHATGSIPQTGNQTNGVLAAIGTALVAGLGWLGFRKFKH